MFIFFFLSTPTSHSQPPFPSSSSFHPPRQTSCSNYKGCFQYLTIVTKSS